MVVVMKKFFISILFFSFSKVEANRAYITNEKDNTVSVIDINKKKVIKIVQLANTEA